VAFDDDRRRFLRPGPLWRAFAATRTPKRHVVLLLDEIDKAPRDLPNDLLMEFDELRFEVPELPLAHPDRVVDARDNPGKLALTVNAWESSTGRAAPDLRLRVYRALSAERAWTLDTLRDTLRSLLAFGPDEHDRFDDLFNTYFSDPEPPRGSARASPSNRPTLRSRSRSSTRGSASRHQRPNRSALPTRRHRRAWSPRDRLRCHVVRGSRCCSWRSPRPWRCGGRRGLHRPPTAPLTPTRPSGSSTPRRSLRRPTTPTRPRCSIAPQLRRTSRRSSKTARAPSPRG